jgi:hypothetical protein
MTITPRRNWLRAALVTVGALLFSGALADGEEIETPVPGAQPSSSIQPGHGCCRTGLPSGDVPEDPEPPPPPPPPPPSPRNPQPEQHLAPVAASVEHLP